MTNKTYDLVAQNNESTVVKKYTPERKKRAQNYQSEAELEKKFIEQLTNQAYEYLTIHTEQDLIKNLREQLEKLNKFKFTDKEWKEFFTLELANPNQSIAEKTRTIQEDYIKILKREDGTSKNIRLLDKQNIHNNSLQVINQYETDEGKRKNRYDVTVLVNGLPLVHIELKRRGVALQEAFNQINRYQRESFWASSGLYEYIQIFVISNGTHTKYYGNTTRIEHINELNKVTRRKGKRSSSSFEFTSWWADEQNKPIMDLMDFTKTFFAKHTILNILTKYCVFTSENQLLVMRPYQIAATEKIINKIEVSTNYKQYGTVKAGGYVWHTTGSGKTLTSFKTAQLASKLPYIDKVLFIVDRKDLDYQTMREYDKFEKGAANSNTSTRILKKQLEDPKARIIITTIQKLDKFIKQNKGHKIFNGHVVLIFDECHRSQFGNMHSAITKAFNKYHLFGFTGTPIFAANASSSGKGDLKTTEQVFGEQLHIYTIVDAIADKNVLPFKVDYVSTFKEAEEIENKEVSSIDREAALSSPERLHNIVKYIIEHFDQKTKRNKYYSYNVVKNIKAIAKAKDRNKIGVTTEKSRLSGFNSILAVSSIDLAKKYYAEFKRQLHNLPSDKQLRVALIYSFSANEDIDGMVDENPEDTSALDKSSRDFLENAIRDYNKTFGTSYDTSSDKFQNYYKDISLRVKNREIDILIVVNMFLTGFDAKTLNTLWVDKNLRLHGLLQAYSRTNRILNSIKTFGNIVCFRNLEKATNEAIALFGDKDAKGIVLLKTFEEYYNGYENKGKKVRGYKELVEELLEKFPIGERILEKEKQKEFVKLYGGILRVHNILTTFDEFTGNEILTERDIQDYHSMYIDLYNEFRKRKDSEKENINDDLVFEMELIKQVEINIDYILKLIKKYHEDHIKNKEVLVDIDKAINSSVELRNKKDLIEQFIKSLDISSVIDDDWTKFIEEKKKEELDKIIEKENLNHDETYKFIQNAFRDGGVATTGTSITKVIPPISRFSKDAIRTKKRESVIRQLTKFFEKFFNM
ncbi:MAG: HsdR family type I site-specific deoxyribonuclease [Nitrospiraceae bacterium]|nr:HsdR family type I site-specific deoxyribonuclease [Nitrospiraceae bacterium]